VRAVCQGQCASLAPRQRQQRPSVLYGNHNTVMAIWRRLLWHVIGHSLARMPSQRALRAFSSALRSPIWSIISYLGPASIGQKTDCERDKSMARGWLRGTGADPQAEAPFSCGCPVTLPGTGVRRRTKRQWWMCRFISAGSDAGGTMAAVGQHATRSRTGSLVADDSGVSGIEPGRSMDGPGHRRELVGVWQTPPLPRRKKGQALGLTLLTVALISKRLRASPGRSPRVSLAPLLAPPPAPGGPPPSRRPPSPAQRR
jgi:hypothetical protein